MALRAAGSPRGTERTQQRVGCLARDGRWACSSASTSTTSSPRSCKSACSLVGTKSDRSVALVDQQIDSGADASSSACSSGSGPRSSTRPPGVAGRSGRRTGTPADRRLRRVGIPRRSAFPIVRRFHAIVASAPAAPAQAPRPHGSRTPTPARRRPGSARARRASPSSPRFRRERPPLLRAQQSEELTARIVDCSSELITRGPGGDEVVNPTSVRATLGDTSVAELVGDVLRTRSSTRTSSPRPRRRSRDGGARLLRDLDRPVRGADGSLSCSRRSPA